MDDHMGETADASQLRSTRQVQPPTPTSTRDGLTFYTADRQVQPPPCPIRIRCCPTPFGSSSDRTRPRQLVPASTRAARWRGIASTQTRGRVRPPNHTDPALTLPDLITRPIVMPSSGSLAIVLWAAAAGCVAPPVVACRTWLRPVDTQMRSRRRSRGYGTRGRRAPTRDRRYAPLSAGRCGTSWADASAAVGATYTRTYGTDRQTGRRADGQTGRRASERIEPRTRPRGALSRPSARARSSR
jgi:hypothetical protein